MGWPYAAVGMHSALESAIGLPRRPAKALRMLTFLTPADVRRSLKMPPGSNQIEQALLDALKEPRTRALSD
jgi:hypothetical protein